MHFEELEVDEEVMWEEIQEIFPIRAERVIRSRLDHVQRFSDIEFLKRFRLSKDCFHSLLNDISNVIKPPSERNQAIPAASRLLLTLRFYATGNMLIAVADFCGVSTTSASIIVKNVSTAIANLRPRYCRMPEGNEIHRAQMEFFETARFPSVIGAIDCTHVRIQSPGGNIAENFRNRKGYFSLNIQTVADAKLRILDIVARWPGSSHDQTIFNNSILKHQFEEGNFQTGLLLGDSGYHNRNYLLTPLAEPRTPAERLYNEAHMRTRNVVERQYGVWKRRFQILRLEMRLDINRLQAVIVATAVLHNICINMNVAMPPEDAEDDIAEEDVNNDVEIDGRENEDYRRQEIIEYFSNLQ